MSNLMEKSLRFLVEQRLKTSSVSAVYANDHGEFSVRAVPCKSAGVSDDEFDLTVEANALDFIIPAEDLKDDPKPGDRITANGRIYEVNSYKSSGVGVIAWKWCEGCYEVARRVHTKSLGFLD